MPETFRSQPERNGGQANPPRSSVGDRLEKFEQRQRQLWRLTYFLLGLLTLAYVLVSWDTIRTLAQRYEVLLIGLGRPGGLIHRLRLESATWRFQNFADWCAALNNTTPPRPAISNSTNSFPSSSDLSRDTAT